MATKTSSERDTGGGPPKSELAHKTRRMTPTLAICMIAGFAVAAALFLPATETPPAPAATAAPAPASKVETGVARTEPIEIVSFAYNDITVPAGAVVEVRNLDDASHTVTAVDGTFGTPTISGPGAATFVAPSASGTYPYFCALHPSMQGTLIVE